MEQTSTTRLYDPLARLRDGDWTAYGCTTPDCTIDHEVERLKESAEHYWRCLERMPRGGICMLGQAHAGRCSAVPAR